MKDTQYDKMSGMSSLLPHRSSPRSPRSFRCPDDLWSEVQDAVEKISAAAEVRCTPTDLILAALIRYLESDDVRSVVQ